MLKIFTNILFKSCIFASSTILLVQIVKAQAPVKKNEQPSIKPAQLYPINEVKGYPGNSNLPLDIFITMQEAIKNYDYMRITEAKLTTYGEFTARALGYNSTYSENRMVWIIRGFVLGKYSYIGRVEHTCIAGARILALVDAQTGDSLGRFVNCPPGNERKTSI